MPGITCVNAKGAFYLFPNISKLGLEIHGILREAAVEQEKVACGARHRLLARMIILRISYATSMGNIEKWDSTGWRSLRKVWRSNYASSTSLPVLSPTFSAGTPMRSSMET